MFTTRSFRHLVWGALVLGASHAQGQVSVPGHSGVPGDHLGWNAGTLQALEVRHDGNQQIQWYTDALHRMGLYPNVNNTVNGYTINQTGYFGLSDEPAFFTGSGPFSKIHLVEAMGSTNPVNYAQVLGFRDWMRNGVTMTGNSDQCYIGAKYNEDDNSDLVLQWSDNPEDAIYGTDRLRFLFTNRRSTSGALFGARSEEGLESFRVFVEDDFNANVGIGDFFRESVQTASVVDPTERLDVLDGRLRIRELPNDPAASALTRFLVVDDTPGSPEFGVVKWRNVPVGTGAGCEWTLLGAAGSNSNIATAYNSNPGCPQGDRGVGIGTNVVTAKLDVVSDVSQGGSNTGVGIRSYVYPSTGAITNQQGVSSQVDNATGFNVAIGGIAKSTTGSTTTNVGISGFAQVTGGTVALNYAGDFLAQLSGSGSVTTNRGLNSRAAGGTNSQGLWAEGGGGTNNTGVVARGIGNATSASNYGVNARANNPSASSTVTCFGVYAYGDSPLSTSTCYGVYGRVTGGSGGLHYSIYGDSPGVGGNDWSGYFAGRTYVAGTVFVPSDENLKSGIEPLGNAIERLLQLNPKTYLFRTAEFPTMGLPSEQQYGFLASELQEVFPEMVLQTTHPASYDSSGVEISPNIPFKAVNLSGLTPMLVAAFQVQQATIADLTDRLAQMESRLDGCCSGSPSDGRSNATEEGNGNSSTIVNNRTLRIVPNPMQDQATIHYQLERSGRMQLLVNSNDGKELRVLKEANTEAGTYQYEWATEGLAPGVYYVTLLLDGQPITKQVIKIDR